jgi:hypothetical protein
VAVENLAYSPSYTHSLSMGAWAIDGFLPVIPASKEKKGNSLSLTGEFARGSGIADLYTGLTGNMKFGLVTNPATGAQSTFSADIDNGIVAYDASGNLHSIDYQSYIVGAQYYLPGLDGKLWVSGNYSHMFSDNMAQFIAGNANVKASSLLSVYDWFDFNVFVDPTPALRIGAEYANFNTQYVDGQHAINHRGQLSGWFIF